MKLFWQLSGPERHVVHDWKTGKGNAADTASKTFQALSSKHEDGSRGVDLILGIEPSGASQILVSRTLQDADSWHLKLRGDPYPGSKFNSLSPIRVDTVLRLQTLLEDRQRIAGKKKKGDTSKANKSFYAGAPNTARAAFEHSRCFWRILCDKLHPCLYGLPDAEWQKSISIFSLSLNFWSPGGTRHTNELLDTGLTQLSLLSTQKQELTVDQTWYLQVKENKGLQNSLHAQEFITPEAWQSFTIAQDEIGSKIQEILMTRPGNGPPAPLILLVHDCAATKDGLKVLRINASQWKSELKELLGFDTFERDRRRQQSIAARDVTHDSRSQSSSRARSRSPRARTAGLFLRETRSPSPTRAYAPVYLVDTAEMFKTVTKQGEHVRRIRPSTVLNTLACKDEPDVWCAGSDSVCIAQAWKLMAQGPSVDEQHTFYTEQMRSKGSWPVQHEAPVPERSEAPEDMGLFQVQKNSYIDRFNDGPDSDDDGW